ncbi:hypothetical protein HDV02_006759 [Globomyces sp. JEL0801]|nr:hypothetical protein HDV02_006759 [Globomyces sp. JEL0801]
MLRHHANLAHGSAVQLARQKYSNRNFKFGMPLIATWGVPLSSSKADLDAQDRFMTFQTKWNWGPLIDGDYPAIMKSDRVIGKYLPKYTTKDMAIMKGTIDFIAINYYSASYVQNRPGAEGNYSTTWTKDGVAIGPVSGTDWQAVYTPGIRGILQWLHKTFNMEIMVSECGTSVRNESKMSLLQVVRDTFRVNFFEGITKHLYDAISIDKLPVTSFIAWSLVDNFEWNTYDQRFGVIAINRTSLNLTRTIKDSALFLNNYFTQNTKSPFKNTLGSASGPTIGSNGGSQTNSDIFHFNWNYIITIIYLNLLII